MLTVTPYMKGPHAEAAETGVGFPGEISARWVRFLVVGGLGVGVQFAVLEVLGVLVGVPYLVATAAAVSAAVVHNFLWHRHWTWHDRLAEASSRRRDEAFSRRQAEQFVRFAVANGAVSLAGNVVVMAALVGGAGLNLIVANAIAITVCGVANYWLADVVVFRAATE